MVHLFSLFFAPRRLRKSLLPVAVSGLAVSSAWVGLAALRYWVLAANTDGCLFDYADGPSQEFFTTALANTATC